MVNPPLPAAANRLGEAFSVTRVVAGGDVEPFTVVCVTERTYVPCPKPVSCSVDQDPSRSAVTVTSAEVPLLSVMTARGSAVPETIG